MIMFIRIIHCKVSITYQQGLLSFLIFMFHLFCLTPSLLKYHQIFIIAHIPHISILFLAFFFTFLLASLFYFFLLDKGFYDNFNCNWNLHSPVLKYELISFIKIQDHNKIFLNIILWFHENSVNNNFHGFRCKVYSWN